MERRRKGNILEKGSTGSRPGRGGGSWGELPWASVLGWDPHWSEQLEWNVPGIKRLPLLHISPYGVALWSLRVATPEPPGLEPVFCNKRNHLNEKAEQHNQRAAPACCN